MSDERNRIRVEIGKVAFAKGDGVSISGVIEDISANGAAISFGSPLAEGDSSFAAGDALEIVVDRMTTLAGWVVRADRNGVAVEFAHDDEGEDRLIAEIMDSM